MDDPWLTPEQYNTETGQRRELVKKIVVCDGMAKTAWLTPDEAAKQATAGKQMLPSEASGVNANLS